ncbi:MAG TPA: NUDIX domain-containing protein [Steroidobacteraceae bacterium]|nr:NUDIX domain-containing protein [Steroidobacteraceae bacterium]
MHRRTLQADCHRGGRGREGFLECLRSPHSHAPVGGGLGDCLSIPDGRTHTRRLSAGVVVVNAAGPDLLYLLLRAYRNWDFPKGLVEPGEQPLDAALREVREETTLENLAFDWGTDFMDTGPYNKGKISRYYIARSSDTRVHLPINPELGFPEHQEARWVKFDTALAMVSPRLKPVLQWASATIGAPTALKE